MQWQSEYTFKFDWETVVKGFWIKYPCKELDFIKFNQVVDMVLNPDNTMSVKRLVLTRKFVLWSLQMEEIKLDFKNRTMEMQTELVKACKLYPNIMGNETIVYKAKDNEATYYSVRIYIYNRKFLKIYPRLFLSAIDKSTLHSRRELKLLNRSAKNCFKRLHSERLNINIIMRITTGKVNYLKDRNPQLKRPAEGFDCVSGFTDGSQVYMLYGNDVRRAYPAYEVVYEQMP